ncbi:MAG: hypothetical protein ACE5GG_00320 [Candidatus Omnitrophota bacterium]
MQIKTDTKGVSLLEYALSIVLVVGALMVMAGFIRRSLQARWQDAADVFGEGRQYEKGVTAVISPALKQ